MKVEFQFNSVQIDQQDMQVFFPGLITMINSSIPTQKKTKRRKRKRKKGITVGLLINEIIADIEK